jgi:putative oxidoreductase
MARSVGFPFTEFPMASGSGAQGGAVTLGRWLLAAVFVVAGALRLWAALRGVPTSDTTLAFSLAQLLVGVLIVAGWQLRWTALAAVALVLIDAVLSHPFWAVRASARTGQMLQFLQQLGLAGGFLLLSAMAPRR